LKQQAVLFRTSSHSGTLEVELTRRNIPHVKFGGLKFLDAAHVKDVMAVLRFLQNPPERVVGFRVMQRLPGVGPVSAQRVLDHITTAADPIRALASAPPPARVGPDWTGFLDLVSDLADRDLGWPGNRGRWPSRAAAGTAAAVAGASERKAQKPQMAHARVTVIPQGGVTFEELVGQGTRCHFANAGVAWRNSRALPEGRHGLAGSCSGPPASSKRSGFFHPCGLLPRRIQEASLD
jgi:hypothetical protein